MARRNHSYSPRRFLVFTLFSKSQRIKFYWIWQAKNKRLAIFILISQSFLGEKIFTKLLFIKTAPFQLIKNKN
jgi:hypothetical protein